MVSKKELETRLKLMAEDFHLPGGGRMKLSRLVVRHLWWFDAAEQRGMSWQDMIRAMTAAEVTGRGSKPVSVGTLSSTVWRVRTKNQEANGASERKRARPAPTLPSGQPRRSAKSQGIGQPQQDIREASPQIGINPQPIQGASKRATNDDPPGRVNRDVLKFMDRARAVRRRSEGD